MDTSRHVKTVKQKLSKSFGFSKKDAINFYIDTTFNYIETYIDKYIKLIIPVVYCFVSFFVVGIYISIIIPLISGFSNI